MRNRTSSIEKSLPAVPVFLLRMQAVAVVEEEELQEVKNRYHLPSGDGREKMVVTPSEPGPPNGIATLLTLNSMSAGGFTML